MDSKTLINSIQQWLHLKSKASVEGSAEPPIPAEIFSAEQMERYGITLALSHQLTQKTTANILLSRLSDSETTLLQSYTVLNKKIEDNEGFSPAREWLLDNFYLIQEQIQAIRRHLPKGYGNALPQLAGSLPGYPRVYDIAIQIIEHGDGRWGLENLNRFITAYQSVAPLTLGELWAIPIVLSVALIENLSSASIRVITDKNDRDLANSWADRMIEVALSDPKRLVIIIAEMAGSSPPMSSAFVAELVRRLQGAALALPLTWIEQQLAEDGLTIEQLVQEENRQQATSQATVRNGINSLRYFDEVNWRDFVEAMSVVDETLRTDPTNTYSYMDFGTRDRYRHVIEKLARASLKSESEVANTAIRLAKVQFDSKSDNNNPETLRHGHVGFYLIDSGLSQLERVLGIRHSLWQKICHFCTQHALVLYFGSIFLITTLVVSVLLLKASQSEINVFQGLVLFTALVLCASQLAMALVNLAATLLVKPALLPRMDFSKGIPAEWRAAVVVPTMLGSMVGIESLVEALEVRFLGNRDQNIHFILLTDFNDAPTEQMPDDIALLTFAKEQIDQLNKRYAEEDTDIFFLCHRPRLWNANENIWMGKERKRGKLTDLNNLLRGNNPNGFLLIAGRTNILAQVKYIITLDTDTQLPRESARQLVGAMAHPLNRPRIDAEQQRVIEGYGILQPRVNEVLTSFEPTRYVRLCGNEFGLDPYTRAVSDVYQDIFHEGSFIGKGIYDVDAYQQVLGHSFPDNQILSHDLLEGCYLHSGFLSDVSLYEKSPSSYLADAKRRTRWIRGDWQLIGWLLPHVLNKKNRRIANPLRLLSKLKLFDNLRRSLVALALLILLGLTFTILPPIWLGIILAIVILPLAAQISLDLIRKSDDTYLTQHITYVFQSTKRHLGQLVLYLTCLPHEAWYSVRAIMLSCWRITVSKCHLLEWEPSDQVDKRLRDTPTEYIINMWVGPAIALAAILALEMNGKWISLLLAAPLLALWFASPLITCWLSQPIKCAEPELDPVEIRFLRRMARKTWYFFATFVTAEDHWLPPDNYQEAPVEVLARRTSPTNMGLALLSNLSAYDFGYISISQLLARTQNTLQTMASLEQYHGHFYNWYSTETLAPLLPRYISTVDSGNLAGHLLTLRQGLLGLLDAPLLNIRYLEGLEDTWDVLSAAVNKSLPLGLNDFHLLLRKAKIAFTSWPAALASCHELCKAAEQIATQSAKSDVALDDIAVWSQQLLMQCYALRDEITIFAHVPQLPATITLRGSAQFTDHALESITLIDTLATLAFSLAQMDVSFLYDQSSHLMTIGFNVDEQRCDTSRYDLLSSEARLGSFVAIAQGRVLQESWFALGRLLVSSGGDPVLISWSGSMFEYLMPLLVMPTYPFTLLDQTYRAIVSRQINYGKQHEVPWGVSESGYNAVDTQFNYLYRAFGVPGLGLKRGLEDDLVIAPYASAMALMVEPKAACLNLQRLAEEYGTGRYGFYEAIDFTPARLSRDSKYALVRSFMAHHQGMSLLAFSYLLHERPMQKRFTADPLFQAALLLLQERIPKPTASYLEIPKSPTSGTMLDRPEASMRVFTNPNTRTPQVQLLSNGNYHLVLTQAGGGYSRWKDLILTRWREDSTCDNRGLFAYIRDLETRSFWSTGYQPTLGDVENFKCIFTEAYAEFSRSDKWLDIRTEVVVSPEDDIELRRVRIHNTAKISRTIEFTSYGEIVLAPLASDLSQPAFSNLFVETELVSQQAILATRRQADPNAISPWLCHLLNVYSDQAYTLSFETDRARFIGRGRTPHSPLAMLKSGDLSNTSGAVLDPIFAIRCRFTLKPDDLITLDLLTGVADTREHCIALVEKYQDRQLANRIFGLAWTHGQVLLHQLNISEANAQLYSRLASAIIYASNTRRAEQNILASNRLGQSSLWSYAISGDLPIVLVHIADAANIELVQHLIQAQAYWRRKGLEVDLVILNEEQVSYRQSLQDQLMSLTNLTSATEHGGKIVVRLLEQVSLEDRTLFQSVARVILPDKNGTLKEQLSRRRPRPPLKPLLSVTKSPHNRGNNELPPLTKELPFFNGLGGFSNAGDEYIIRLTAGANTPAPWANIIANPNFGTLVSESGQGYTWTENAQQFRLTPWDNDPIEDSAGEAFYLRDDETGHVWSPTILPCRGQGDYHIRHGFGYSVFEHIEDDIHTEMWVYVALDASIKFVTLKIRNDSTRRRQLSATGYVAWVLGDIRVKNAMHVVTELTQNGSILAQNYYNTDFGQRTAFFDARTSNLGLRARTVTGDRAEFIGRNGTQQNPAALKRKGLSGHIGAGFNPCGAIQLAFDLPEGQVRDIVFVLGAGRDKQEAETLLQRYHGVMAAQSALAVVRQHWQQKMNVTRVMTPDPAVNLLANGWLAYQVLASRLWGRTGYYQSSGAFGFRDQLQDVMSLTHIAPELFRAQLLLCAAHQFEAGDVQHWWHPPLNRGVRTRCSDDYLWLPYAICHYIETTNDIAVLDETIPFLQGRPLQPEEESYYELSTLGTEAVSLYQHAVRAIKNGLRFGIHGLPLIGTCDWNDGMSMVGNKGKGESIWLGFFLYAVLKRFTPLALRYGDNTLAEECQTECAKLQQHIEANGWDGQWYLRAYFDDGSRLGSAQNSECQIDSIAQSWSVLSGAGDPLRAKQAMMSAYRHLVSAENGVVKLLAPPFDTSRPSPGYIQGYVPGIRENGGQYTHGAVWATMAFAELGEKELAWELFNIINPINHGRTPQEVERYKIEPYVIAGDVYSVAPHIGRGGWSWYTGSAGWLYRLITETLLGIRLVEGKHLHITPMLPDNWDGFSINYQFGSTTYHIIIQRVPGSSSIQLDDVLLESDFIPLTDDGLVHNVSLSISKDINK